MKNFLSFMWVAMVLLFSLASSARPFDKVVAALISVVPEEENIFKQELKDILSSFQQWEHSERICFTDPHEIKKIEEGFWDKVTVLLKKKFKAPEKLSGWQLEIFEIYMDKRDYKNYQPQES